MFRCGPCHTADPTSDTVKVDFSGINKENEDANAAQLESQKAEEEAKRQRAEAQRAEEEARKRRAEKEQQELHRRAQEQERELQRRREEEARLKKQAEEEEAQRQREEQARREEEERARQEQLALESRARQEQIALAEANRRRLSEFLSEAGFTDVNGKARKNMTTRCPLHVAAKRNNAEMVQLLLEAKANPAQTNSAGRTPAQVAEKCNKDDSHTRVIALLRECNKGDSLFVNS